ncbi:uncharacterized protein LOC144437716 [Glandiceps talaboti]
MQTFFHEIVPYLQLFLYNKHYEVYSKLKDDNMAGLLKTMQFGQVGKLQVIYRIINNESIQAEEDVVCGVNNKREFYIDKNFVEEIYNYPDIRREIKMMFGRGDAHCQQEINNFLRMLVPFITGQTKESEEGFLENQELEELDTEEIRWEVEKPAPPPTPPTPSVITPSILFPLPIIETATDEGDEDGKNTNVKKPDLNEDGTPVLPCWPPKAGGYGTPSRGGKTNLQEAEDASLKMWPPPAPIEEQKSKSETPYPRENTGPVTRREPDDTADSHGVTTERVQDHRGDQLNSDGKAETVKSQPRNDESRRQHNMSDTHRQDEPRHQHSTSDTHGERSELLDSKDSQNKDENQRGKRDELPANHRHEGREGTEFPSNQENEDARQPQESGSSEKDRHHFSGNHSMRSPRKRFFDFSQPLWKSKDLDEALEDLGSGEVLMKQLPQGVTIDDFESDGDIEIGKWGEALVYNFLLQQKEDLDSEKCSVQINWVNQEQESGQPYDIEIQVQMTDEGSDDVIEYSIYIEVKSTKSKEKKYFEISSKEVAFAEKMKEQFYLYRVYNAGNADRVKLCRIQNLAEKLDVKTVRLCMFV